MIASRKEVLTVDTGECHRFFALGHGGLRRRAIGRRSRAGRLISRLGLRQRRRSRLGGSGGGRHRLGDSVETEGGSTGLTDDGDFRVSDLGDGSGGRRGGDRLFRSRDDGLVRRRNLRRGELAVAVIRRRKDDGQRDEGDDTPEGDNQLFRGHMRIQRTAGP